MIIYLVNIALLFLYGLILLKDNSQRNKRIFCILASWNWIVLSGLRHLTIGADTIKYGYFFEQAKKISWATLWNDRSSIFIHGSMGKDPGYIVFQKLTQFIIRDYRGYLILIALIFIVPLGIWIYRNSGNFLMSFIIYSCLFYSFFSITGTRQTIATAMVVFVGYRFIKERKCWLFLLLILIATSIHFSAICYLPFYFMANKKITDKYIVLFGCGFIGILLLKEPIYKIGSSLLGYDQYLPYEESATAFTFSLFLIALTAVTLLKRNEILKNNEQAMHYINSLLIATLLVPFTFVNPSAMRVIQYFSLSIMLLVPEIINSFQKRERFFVFFVACSTLIILLIRNHPLYLFFWQ